MRDEKLHAIVARSELNFTKHLLFGALLEVEMLKSPGRCGAKHSSKSKCTKHIMMGALLEVETLQKCTLLWRCEAHVEVKMHKTRHDGSTFES